MTATTRKASERQMEVGWLIEKRNSATGSFAAEWWCPHRNGGAWTQDSRQAIRFARECDAQAYIDSVGWTEAKPTEHAWSK